MPGLTRSSSERDEAESPSDTPSTPNASESNKRQRLSRNDPSIPHGDLDDSWALPPPTIARATQYELPNGSPLRTSRLEHRPGQIVRVTMKDFVTYSQAEFNPGPTLNMIIGPNGTGKSSLVCAICLGLGWGPQHLGRASSVGEFVKKGRPEAEIEIELKGLEGRNNRIIKRIIKADGNKSTWSIDGEQSNNKRVLECSRGFNIQVDNLCHFLPQDRVVEFSRLEPVERLTSTLQAAASPEVTEWHNELKSKRTDQRRIEKERSSLQDQLKNLEGRQEAQRQDVERLRERGEIRKRVDLLEQIRPLAEWHAAKTARNNFKDQCQTLTVDIKRLKRENRPALEEANNKEAHRAAIAKVMEKRLGFAARFEAQVKRKEDERKQKERAKEDLKNQKKIAKDSEKKIFGDIAKNRNVLRSLEGELQTEPPEFNSAEYNEKIRERERDINRLSDELGDLQEEGNNAAARAADLKARISSAERQIEQLQTRTGQQKDKLKSASLDTYRAWEWIQENQDRFTSRVYGPPIVECSVKDMRHADTVESLLQKSEFVAITCTNSSDFQMLQNQVYGMMKLNDVTLRNQAEPLERYRAPLSEADANECGVQGWAIDYVSGPESVLAMLCSEARLHSTAVFSGDISDDQYQRLTTQTSLSNWVTDKSIFRITRRQEYNAVSTSVRPLGKAQMWTAQPVDGAAVNEIKHEISEMQQEREGLVTQQEQRTDQRKRKRANLERLKEEKEQIEEEKAEKQKERSYFNTLPQRIDKIKNSLENLAKHAEENEQTVKDIYRQESDLMIAKGQLSIDIVNLLDRWRQASEKVVLAKIALAEAESEAEAFLLKSQEGRQELETKESELKALEVQQEAARKKTKEWKTKSEKIIEEKPEVREFYSEMSEEERQRSPEDLGVEIDSQRARLELLAGGNEGAITEWEERGRRIEQLQNKALDLDATLGRLQDALAAVRAQFEPAVDALMRQISGAFAASFARINCAGSVEVHKHGADGADFDAWAVNILVSFRGGEHMSALDSHRQSGGERAVSTIFYLMALQSLSRAPFRVVDEINQGMDPRNERVVHERLVGIACGDEAEGEVEGEGEEERERAQGSQYFLVTPKLLTGLMYGEGMKVHCIASGEHMPRNGKLVDFRALVDAQRSRNRANGATARRVGVSAA
ncbi:hypothetical protein FH972_021286 [Carpinus fangiana]|uniref:Structural maintenance of chromosomes protein 5 n=1 Tax=Carpinus fangiana TaxID=176857 RepID=A0A5N6KNW8_9ROSI|nr:hypothetical protein FH972_021286 [Carpinus fangiana]